MGGREGGRESRSIFNFKFQSFFFLTVTWSFTEMAGRDWSLPVCQELHSDSGSPHLFSRVQARSPRNTIVFYFSPHQWLFPQCCQLGADSQAAPFFWLKLCPKTNFIGGQQSEKIYLHCGSDCLLLWELRQLRSLSDQYFLLSLG